MSLAQSYYSALTDTEFLNWSAFTKSFGLRPSFIDGYKQLTPKDFYISCCLNKFAVEDISTPIPIPPLTPTLSDFYITAPTSVDLFITYSGGSSDPEIAILFKMSDVHPLSIRSRNSVPHTNIWREDYAPNLPINVYDYWNFRYNQPALSLGKRIFVEAIQIHKPSGIVISRLFKSFAALNTPQSYTFGTTSILPNLHLGVFQQALKYSTPSRGWVNSITWYFDNPVDSYRLGLYNDLGNSPFSLIAQTDLFTPSAGSGWYVVPLISPSYQFSGNQLWLAIASSGPMRTRRQSGSTNFNLSSTSGSTLLANWPGGVSSLSGQSGYATGSY